MSKVSIIGAGAVGSACANCLAQTGIVNEIVLLDIVEGIAEGKALDIRQAAALLNFDTRLRGVTNDYKATESSDIVIVTSGVARKPGMSRDDLISTNASIIKSVVEQIAAYTPESIIIMVSNPLDIMSHYAFQLSGFPKNRVMGMSGLLDTARYKSFIADKLNVSTKDIHAIVLGGHGDTMVPLPRHTTVGGIPLQQLMDKDEIDDIIHRTRYGGDELVSLLGTSAWVAAGAAITKMIKAIICQQQRIVPVSAYLEGEYGLHDIFLGVPVLLGGNGIEKVIEIDLNEDEKNLLYQSAEAVRMTGKQL